MKVALIHDFLVKMGGAERVLKCFSELYPDAPIYTLLYDERVCGKVFPASRVRPSFLQKFPAFLRKRQKYLFPLMPRAIENFDLAEFDLIISSSNAFAHGVLTSAASTHISYCHSPMRYAWDYTHEYLKEQGVNGLRRFLASRMLHSVRMWDFLASDRVDHYLANSHHVQQRIRKYYHRDSAVLYPPVDVHRFTPQAEHDEFFLIVAALTPFKKIDLAVQLFNKIGKKLVVIGSGPQESYLRSIASSNVEILGYQDDKTVQKYMERCRAFIIVNEEDFGIAPVEAMACGKPVLAYAKGGVLETVTSGVSGEFFSQQTIESMEDGLGRLLVNYAHYDSKKIRAAVEKFSSVHFIKGFKTHVSKHYVAPH